jgi:predicted GIY-YIG superfamily endonuclease
MEATGVYVFKRRKQFLYVGCTADLSDRPTKRDRGHVNRFAAILEFTSVKLIPCVSIEKAKQKEEELIRTFHPKYNLRNPRAEADLVGAHLQALLCRFGVKSAFYNYVVRRLSLINFHYDNKEYRVTPFVSANRNASSLFLLANNGERRKGFAGCFGSPITCRGEGHRKAFLDAGG